jgi:hypothetical protein
MVSPAATNAITTTMPISKKNLYFLQHITFYTSLAFL